jgi:hypothetical protein
MICKKPDIALMAKIGDDPLADCTPLITARY